MTTSNTIITAQDYESLLKYPRTPHLEGSRLQPGDEGHNHVPYATLLAAVSRGEHAVIEEKLDGANSGVSFNAAGDLLLQCRGHYLVGGGRERQFNLFKRWAQAHEAVFLERLEDRYVMYGEWMHKLHSVYYDALPHFFVEFDIWDRQRQVFLSTARRQELLNGLPVLSVPVLSFKPSLGTKTNGAPRAAAQVPARLKDFLQLVRGSQAKSPNWRKAFVEEALKAGLSESQAWLMADKSDRSEGLYIKIETADETVGRLKWVRSDFVQAIVQSGKHHSEQPYVANQLLPGVDIFSPELTHDWTGAL